LKEEIDPMILCNNNKSVYNDDKFIDKNVPNFDKSQEAVIPKDNISNNIASN